jgi:acetyl-CoA acyltransferase
MNQLARQFEEDPSVRFGMTTMCIGLGMGATVIWENPHHAGYGTETPSTEAPGTEAPGTETHGTETHGTDARQTTTTETGATA